MLYKTLKNVEFKFFESDGESMIVEAYASIFGNKDSGNDIVEKGAFTKTLSENKKRIKTLFNHDWNQIIGKPLQINEDSKGLYTKTQFVSTLKSEEVYTLVKENIVNELSIGYDIVKAQFDNSIKANRLKELRLYEYSFVTFAMNQEAQVTGVKSFIELFEGIKSGRMLSDKNVNSINKIIEELNALLEDNGTPFKPETSLLGDLANGIDINACKPPKKSQIDKPDFDLILKELKQLNLK